MTEIKLSGPDRPALPELPIFHTKLIVSQIGRERLWLTEAPFVVESAYAGLIEIPAGFLFDGNSVPRLTWSISPPSDYLASACVHDYLYRYFNDRKLADVVYRELLGAQGMGKAQRNLRYLMLRLFGGHAFRKHAHNK
jgi:hypothetical protein